MNKSFLVTTEGNLINIRYIESIAQYTRVWTYDLDGGGGGERYTILLRLTSGDEYKYFETEDKEEMIDNLEMLYEKLNLMRD